MMKTKIPQSWKDLVKKKRFYFRGKRITPVRDIQISRGGPLGIQVEKRFFEYFNPKERIAILWHERYHGKILKFNNKNEIKADIYSAKKTGQNCLKYLMTLKYLIKNKKIIEDGKHPSIDCRIQKVKEFLVLENKKVMKQIKASEKNIKKGKIKRFD